MDEEKKATNIDPNILLDSIDEIDILIKANIQILETVKSLLKKFIDSGIDPSVAAGMAVSIQRHAADKAKEKVTYEEVTNSNAGTE